MQEDISHEWAGQVRSRVRRSRASLCPPVRVMVSALPQTLTTSCAGFSRSRASTAQAAANRPCRSEATPLRSRAPAQRAAAKPSSTPRWAARRRVEAGRACSSRLQWGQLYISSGVPCHQAGGIELVHACTLSHGPPGETASRCSCTLSVHASCGSSPVIVRKIVLHGGLIAG